MNIKFYPKISTPHDRDTDGSFTRDDIASGRMWLQADVTCPNCGKEQTVAQTGSVGGPCCRCGKRTSHKEPE